MIDYIPSNDVASQCELCYMGREIAHLREQLADAKRASREAWRFADEANAEREKMRAAAEEARRVLSMPLLMEGDASVVQALKMLDEALGKSTPSDQETT